MVKGRRHYFCCFHAKIGMPVCCGCRNKELELQLQNQMLRVRLKRPRCQNVENCRRFDRISLREYQLDLEVQYGTKSLVHEVDQRYNLGFDVLSAKLDEMGHGERAGLHRLIFGPDYQSVDEERVRALNRIEPQGAGSSRRCRSTCSLYYRPIRRHLCVTGKRYSHRICHFHSRIGMPVCCRCRLSRLDVERDLHDFLCQSRRLGKFPRPRSQFANARHFDSPTVREYQLDVELGTEGEFQCLHHEVSSAFPLGYNVLVDHYERTGRGVRAGVRSVFLNNLYAEQDIELVRREIHPEGLITQDSFQRWERQFDERIDRCLFMLDELFQKLGVHEQGQGQSTSSGSTYNVSAQQGSTIHFNVSCDSNASGLQSQAFDMNKFASQVLSGALKFGRKLASPSVEESGYSDRLTQLSFSDTFITSQESSKSAICAYGAYPREVKFDNCDIAPSVPGPAVERFYRVTEGEWRTGDATGTVLASPWFPNVLKTKGVFGQMCNAFNYTQCGFCVVVTLAGSPFHGGCLGVYAIPNGTFSTGSRALKSVSKVELQSYGFYPHQWIMPRTTNTATLILPFHGPSPEGRTTGQVWWQLAIVVLTPLVAPSGATPSLKFDVDCAPMSARFQALKGVSTQGLPVENVPGSGCFSTTFAYDSHFLYPRECRSSDYSPPGRVQSVLQMLAVPQFIDCVNSDATRLAISFNATATSSSQDPPLATIALRTQNLPTGRNRSSFVYTGFAWILNQYVLHRGTLDLTFTFTGPQMTKGKLLVVYYPPGSSAVATKASYQDCMFGIWDVGLQSSFTFPVPFASCTPFQCDFTTATQDLFDDDLGFVCLFIYTQIVVPPSCSGYMDILVQVAAGEDYVVSLLCDPKTNIIDPQGDVKIDESGAAALSAAETGDANALDVSSVVASEPSRIYNNGYSSTIEGFFDQYSFHSWVDIHSNNTGEVPHLVIDAGNLGMGLSYKLSAFTYFRATIDLMFVPCPDNELKNLRIQATFFPFWDFKVDSASAAFFDYLGFNSKIFNPISNPTIFFPSGPTTLPVHVSLPFMSTASVYVNAFNGSNLPSESTQVPANYGLNSNHIGKFAFKVMTPTSVDKVIRVMVYVKLRDVEVFMPKVPMNTPSYPGFRSSVVDVDAAYSLTAVLPWDTPEFESGFLGLCHVPFVFGMDVAIVDDGIVFVGIFQWLLFFHVVWPEGVSGYFEDLLAFVGQSLGKGFTRPVVDALTVADNESPWFREVVSWLVKFVCAVVIISRSTADPAVIAAMSCMLGVDLLTCDPVRYFKKKLWQVLAFIPEIELEGGPLSDFNAALRACQGVDWLIQKLASLITWLKDIFQGRVQEQLDLASQAQNFLSLCREWDDYIANPTKFSRKSVLLLAKQIVDFKDKLPKMNKPPPGLPRVVMQYSKEALHELRLGEGRSVEPVGVLIKGSPGTGKSLCTSLIAKALSLHYNWNEPYSLPPDPKFFDGYNQQQVVIMDDLGQNPDGEDMSLLCQMISSVNFHPPMASLEDKGISFNSRVVLASTNLAELRPPTVASSDALYRRFPLNLKIHVNADYRNADGSLNVEAALSPCKHTTKFFPKCCPLICGLAVNLSDENSGEVLSLSGLVGRVIGLLDSRVKVSKYLDAIFEGPQSVLRPAATRVPPREIVDLLSSIPRPEIIDWAEQQGYIIPAMVTQERVRKDLISDVKFWQGAVMALTALVAVCSAIYATCSMLKSGDVQGPYGGKPIPTAGPPQRRVAAQGTRDANFDFMQKLLLSNLLPVVTSVSEFTGLGLKDRFLLLPTHAIGRERSHSVAGVERQIKCVYHLDRRNLPLELSVVEYSDGDQFRDITRFFPEQQMNGHNATLVINSPSRPRMQIPVKNFWSYGTLNMSGTLVSNTICYDAQTFKGACGGVLIKPGKIIAMHIAGDGYSGYGAALTRGIFKFLDVPAPEAAISNVKKAENPVYIPHRSCFYPSIWSTVRTPNYQPAVLSIHDKRTVENVEQVAMAKYKGDFSEKVDLEMLNVATEIYFSQLASVLQGDLSTELSMDECVHGFGCLSGIDLTTSPGFPHVLPGSRKSKRELVEDLGFLKQIFDEEGLHQPYVTYYKDELRSHQKVLDANTRLIESQSINDVLNWRRYCGRFFEAYLANFGFGTGSAVGCDPETFWTHLASEIGNTAQAIDFKNFDASIPRVFYESLLQALHKYFGLRVEKIAPDLFHRKHIFCSVEYVVDGGTPSGCAGTSILNSILCNIVLRYIIVKSFIGIDWSGFKMVAYGDDCLFSYTYPLDCVVLVEEAAKIGLGITSSKKDLDFPPPGIWNCTFLSRGFRSDEKIPTLIHPTFPLDRVLDSLCWTKDAANTQGHIDNLLHLIWHNGKEDYDIFVKFVRSVPIGSTFQILPFSVLAFEWYDKFVE